MLDYMYNRLNDALRIRLKKTTYAAVLQMIQLGRIKHHERYHVLSLFDLPYHGAHGRSHICRRTNSKSDAQRRRQRFIISNLARPKGRLSPRRSCFCPYHRSLYQKRLWDH
jgi:hypothetical protein